MKRCPRCSQTYIDDELNFCLNDGERLFTFEDEPPPTLFGAEPDLASDDSPPTVLLDRTRVTNQSNWQPGPLDKWQGQGINSENQPYSPGFVHSSDQSLPTISLVLGILSVILICCWGGIPLGAAALVTGYLGMRNADTNPVRYGGRGLAIGGMVLGIISFLASFIFLFFGILAG